MTNRIQAFSASCISYTTEDSNDTMRQGEQYRAAAHSTQDYNMDMQARVERKGLTAMAACEELFRQCNGGAGAEAELYIVVDDEGESPLLQRGEFALVLVRHSRLPGLAAVAAMVGDVQWPVGRDCPTLRLGRRSGMTRFAFSLPGLTYGLVLDHSISDAQTQTLESLLTQYSMFDVQEDNNIPSALEQASLEMEGAKFWSRLAEEIETRSCNVREKMTIAEPEQLSQHDSQYVHDEGDNISTTADNNSKENDQHNWRTGQSNADGLISGVARTTKRIQKARRMSAIAKLFSQTLIRGAIRAPGHVALGRGAQLAGRQVALAGVNAIAMVAEAIESGAATSASSSQASCSSDDADILQPCTWTLNRLGRRMLVGAVATFLSVRPPPPPASSCTPSSRPFSTSAESLQPGEPRLRQC